MIYSEGGKPLSSVVYPLKITILDNKVIYEEYKQESFLSTISSFRG